MSEHWIGDGCDALAPREDPEPDIERGASRSASGIGTWT